VFFDTSFQGLLTSLEILSATLTKGAIYLEQKSLQWKKSLTMSSFRGFYVWMISCTTWQECFGPGPAHCLSCPEPRLLLADRAACVDFCPLGYAPSTHTRQHGDLSSYGLIWRVTKAYQWLKMGHYYLCKCCGGHSMIPLLWGGGAVGRKEDPRIRIRPGTDSGLDPTGHWRKRERASLFHGLPPSKTVGI